MEERRRRRPVRLVSGSLILCPRASSEPVCLRRDVRQVFVIAGVCGTGREFRGSQEVRSWSVVETLYSNYYSFVLVI